MDESTREAIRRLGKALVESGRTVAEVSLISGLEMAEILGTRWSRFDLHQHYGEAAIERVAMDRMGTDGFAWMTDTNRLVPEDVVQKIVKHVRLRG